MAVVTTVVQASTLSGLKAALDTAMAADALAGVQLTFAAFPGEYVVLIHR
jgi:hypothetical protein